MTVKLQALAIKSKIKVAMTFKNFKAVAMRCKNKGKPKDVTKDTPFESTAKKIKRLRHFVLKSLCEIHFLHLSLKACS